MAEDYFVFHDPRLMPSQMARPRNICLAIILASYLIELFVLLKQLASLSKDFKQYMSFSTELSSVKYAYSMVSLTLVRKTIIYASLFFGILYLRKIWKQNKSSFKFSLFTLLFYELIIDIPIDAYRELIIERRFGFSSGSPEQYIKKRFVKFVFHIFFLYAYLIPILYNSKSYGSFISLTSSKVNKNYNKNFNPNEIIEHNNEIPFDIIEPNNRKNRQSMLKKIPRFWLFVCLHLLFIIILFSALQPLSIYISDTIIPSTAAPNTTVYDTIVSGFIPPYKGPLIVKLNDGVGHLELGIIGCWSPIPYVSDRVINANLNKNELKALGAIISTSVNSDLNLKTFLIALLFPVVFGAIIKIIINVGLTPFGIRKGKPVILVLFIAFSIIYSLQTLVRPVACSMQRQIILEGDCIVSVSGLPVKSALTKLYNANFNNFQHCNLYKLLYGSMPSLDDRKESLKICKAHYQKK